MEGEEGREEHRMKQNYKKRRREGQDSNDIITWREHRKGKRRKWYLMEGREREGEGT